MNDKIVEYLKTNLEATPMELASHLGISRQMVHRYLKEVEDHEHIAKIGKAPVVYYQYRDYAQSQLVMEDMSKYGSLDFIEITIDGKYFKGIQAFKYWCDKRNQPLDKTLQEYENTLIKYQSFYKKGVIDGTDKLKNTKGFEHQALKKLYYLDFYAIERFGKTNLGKLIHFGKQSQNKKLIREIVELSMPKLEQLTKKHKIDAVGYIPPTLPRAIQIMNELEDGFGLPLPHIKLLKVKGDILVPQKALSKLKDRILNTQQSIVVAEKKHYDKILLIDDAVGSGATLNETAFKLLKKGIAKQVIGVAITGSLKGFEVISEA